MKLTDLLHGHGIETSEIMTAEYQRSGDEPIYLLRVSVDQTLEQWRRLRDLVPETGYWPIVGWDRFKRPPGEELSAKEIIRRGMQFDARSWFKRESDTPAVDLISESGSEQQLHSAITFRIHFGRFPHTLASLVPLALIPTKSPWEVPAYLDVTGDDPPPEVHVGVLKYWYEQWEAEPVAMTAGSIEMRVLRPPVTQETALSLAREQYLYCPDLVEQDFGSIATLADLLLNGAVWRFWWD
jgi:hypothetical protein